MNAPGVLLIVVGAWVVTQVLGGNALERLGVVKADQPPAGPSTLAPGPYVPGAPGSGGGGGSGGLPGAGGW